MKICIDPGHGDKDSGAIGPTGLKEKDVAWIIANRVADLLLRHDVDVIFTREGDKYVSLEDRVEIANNNKADYFVSIHINSASNPFATGTETFAFPNSDMGTKLASIIQRALVNEINLADRGVKHKDFFVLKYTKMPAALVEVAFINNLAEEKLLKDDEFLDKAAVGISKGILEHINIKYKAENVPWETDQGLKHLNSLVNKGIIESPEYWQDKILDPMPVWAILSIIDRITKEN